MLSLDNKSKLELPTKNYINIVNKKSNHSQSEDLKNVLHLRSFTQQNIRIRTFNNIRYNGLWTIPSNFKKITDIYEGNFVDEILTNAGNENRPKRSKDPNKRNKTSRKGGTIEQRNILRGINKSDEIKRWNPLSFIDKEDANYFTKPENLNFGVTILGVPEENYVKANELRKHRFNDSCYLDEETKNTVRDSFSFYGLKKDLLEEVLDSNLINEPSDGFKDYYCDIISEDKYTTFLDVLVYILRTSYTYYSPRLTKVICKDVDLPSSTFGDIQRMAIFESFKNTKCLIVSNKQEYSYEKKNHMTVIMFFDKFISYEEAKKIRGIFKLVGMCDPGMNNYGTKNPFNLERFDVYYNKTGELAKIDMPMVEELVRIYKNVFKENGIDINELDIYDIVRNNVDTNEVNFTCTNPFKNFIDKYCTYDLEEKEVPLFKRTEKKAKKKEITTEGYKEFCDFVKESPSKKKLLKYENKVTFKTKSRRYHCYCFGKMVGKCFKAHMNWDDCIKLFKNIVTIEDPEGKHEYSTYIQSLKAGYDDGQKEIKEYLIESKKCKKSGTLGGFTTNANKTVENSLEIFDIVLNEFKKGTKSSKIKAIVRKDHKNYEKLVDALINDIYYCNTINEQEVKLRCTRTIIDFACERTINNAVNTCKALGIYKEEIENRANDAIALVYNKMEIVDFSIVTNEVKKTISRKIINMNDAYYFVKEFKENIRRLFKKNRWCLIE